MPLQDTDSIEGGYSQEITDWALGDDRLFTGQVLGLPVADPNLSDAYFTLKQNPNVPDYEAIFQVHVTNLATARGQITADGLGNSTMLLLHIFAGDYQVYVRPGTAYWWDFRVETFGGITYTVATGQVVFVQNVTQTNKSGIPAPPFILPNRNLPRFRGFIDRRPDLIPGYFEVDIIGDFYRKLNPQPADPSGWVCVASGSPGTWTSDGIVGDIGSGV